MLYKVTERAMHQICLTQNTMCISMSKVQPSHNCYLNHLSSNFPTIDVIVYGVVLTDDPNHKAEIVTVWHSHPHTSGILPHSNTSKVVADTLIKKPAINHGRTTTEVNRDVPALSVTTRLYSSYANPVNYI